MRTGSAVRRHINRYALADCAVKLGRKTLILRADADAWAASLPELRAVGREQASA